MNHENCHVLNFGLTVFVSGLAAALWCQSMVALLPLGLPSCFCFRLLWLDVRFTLFRLLRRADLSPTVGKPIQSVMLG